MSGQRARVIPAELRAAYVDAFRDADTVHAICEEYRAAATWTTSVTGPTDALVDRLPG
jgi:hypothetical protein